MSLNNKSFNQWIFLINNSSEIVNIDKEDAFKAAEGQVWKVKYFERLKNVIQV